MARYALVDRATRVVRNVCEWDGDAAKWAPPADCDPIVSTCASPADVYDPAAGTFTAPAPTPDPLAADLQRLIDYMPVSGSATAQAISAYIADGTKPPELRATMAALRSLIRVVRGIAS